jgi:quercetin dioxygenase-like cupin family protein
MEKNEAILTTLKTAVVVPANLSRWDEPMRTTGEKVWTKVSAKDTGDAWAMFESRVPKELSLPLHVHHEQDEWYWVLEGDFVFEAGGQRHGLSTGMSVLLPRAIPHRWKNNGRDGRLLILVQPAGRMEYFFDRVSKATPEDRKDMGLARQVFAECGMELLGPPME